MEQYESMASIVTVFSENKMQSQKTSLKSILCIMLGSVQVKLFNFIVHTIFGLNHMENSTNKPIFAKNSI